MNRFVQKLIAGAAAVAIAVTGLLGGAPVAKAADPTVGTITIRNADNDTAAHKLNGWKLASLKNVSSTTDGKLNFLIDTNDAMVPVIEASMTSKQLDGYMHDANYYTENGADNNPIGWLVANSFKGSAETSDPWGGDTSALRTFATTLSKKLAEAGAPTATKADFHSSADGLTNTCDQGLWLLKDVSADPTTQSIPIIVATALSGYSGATANWGVVTLKMNVPTIDKKITETATGTVADNGYNADARIGDVVKYELSSVIPSYTGYDIAQPPRVFKLIDTASKGLTVDASSVKSVKLTKGDKTVTLTSNDYAVSCDSYALVEGQEGYNAEYAGGKVTTIDLSNYVNKAVGSTSSTDGILEGATVTVEFEATVNSSAVKAGVGNPNSIELEYSRTPDNVSTKIPGSEVARVYTYEFGILKTDMAGKVIQSSKDLKGAKFAIARVNTDTNAKTFLKRDSETGAWFELTAATPAKDGTEATGVFTTGTDGKITMSGLPAGTYYVEEIEAPTGYTNISLPNFTFTIDSTIDTKTNVATVTYTKTSDTDGNRVSFGTGDTASTAQVKNAKNLTELPMTGDLGIKVFITVGVLLMAAGAAFALSARMRA